jgi:hypothetical protein
MLLSFVLSRSLLSFILGMEVRPIYTRGLLLSQHGEIARKEWMKQNLKAMPVLN